MPDILPRPSLTPVTPDATPVRRGGGRAVLVVERSAIARKFLMQRLEALGYVPHAADDADQALVLVGQQRFAIVFLELKLAGPLDGLGLCQAIKQLPLPAGAIVPAVVVTTGQAGSTNRVRGSLAGCDAYLNKPLLEPELLAALREVDPLFK